MKAMQHNDNEFFQMLSQITGDPKLAIIVTVTLGLLSVLLEFVSTVSMLGAAILYLGKFFSTFGGCYIIWLAIKKANKEEED